MSTKILPLSKAELDTPLKVVMLNTSDARERLQSMGIVTGATLKVLKGGKKDNLLIAIGNTRVAVENEVAGSILVQI